MNNKIHVTLNRELAKELKSMMKKEDNYSTIVSMLLNFYKERVREDGSRHT